MAHSKILRLDKAAVSEFPGDGNEAVYLLWIRFSQMMSYHMHDLLRQTLAIQRPRRRHRTTSIYGRLLFCLRANEPFGGAGDYR